VDERVYGEGLIPAGTFSVRTDPGKVSEVMEFKVEIFQVWKIMENNLSYGKVWKSYGKCDC